MKKRNVLLVFIVVILFATGCTCTSSNTSQEINYKELYNELVEQYDTLKTNYDKMIKDSKGLKKIKEEYIHLLEDHNKSEEIQVYYLDESGEISYLNVKDLVKLAQDDYTECNSKTFFTRKINITVVCNKYKLKDISIIKANGEIQKLKPKKVCKGTYMIIVEPDICEVETLKIECKEITLYSSLKVS